MTDYFLEIVTIAIFIDKLVKGGILNKLNR